MSEASLLEKLKNRMGEMGISPKRSLGQNFLVSQNVIDKIVLACELDQFKNVMEIGPGLGALTDSLIERTPHLLLAEMDQAFIDYWKNQRRQNVLEGDALQINWSEQSWLAEKSLLVSNLPYQIASRLVVDLSFQSPSFDRMVLMFQKEVAKRVVAKHDSEDYSLLTAVAQIFWTPKTLLEAGSVDFFPKPKVASRVLTFDSKKVSNEFKDQKFLQFLKLCFQQKRKKLIGRLEGPFGKEKIHQSFAELGFDTNLRVEKLSPLQLCELYQKQLNIP